MHKLGTKYSMTLGSLFYAMYIASFILAANSRNRLLTTAVILVAASLNGFGASILWVA